MDFLDRVWTLLEYLILGLVQGITEPIPISSSGHLVIFRELFGIETTGLSFEIFVNFASLLAILVIYRKDIIRLIKNGVLYTLKKEEEAKSDFRFIVYLVIATIPVGVTGVLFGDAIGDLLSKPVVVGYTLLITAAALWIIRNLRGRKNDGDLTTKDAIIVGLAQTVALTPGISRSGSTIVASMLVGMKQETALRFSFLLYIPVSLGTAILDLPDMFASDEFQAMLVPNLIAFITAFLASYFALRWFMDIMAKGNLKYFSYYCVVVGILVIIFL
ncbi:undecaprenyl-diphosphate phosphatase [Oceanobacillus halophilus]|uniref:Undecaprenyl-diphosphatase n=1 Tax=Oceanobacillus halophilus TaxID=930130 RepID=A0A495A008_9BACI|nr:undecaprenyl-diphosphate phosphatase [Oceanobacillus halophilus]RKQ32615.1 undecaprenyl-diphosphate phosphatase [Oceanobacillus halophilus]